MPTAGSPFSITPTLALSDKMLIAGSSESAVEASVKRSAAGKSRLASSENFRAAEGSVPPAKQAFFYVDTALLYTRLDAAIRPMLMMSAAFVPSVNENVDLSKFPPPEAITKHLSPIVMSQNYQTDGYVTESVRAGDSNLSGCGGRCFARRCRRNVVRQRTHGGAFPNLVPSFSSPGHPPLPSPSPDTTP